MKCFIFTAIHSKLQITVNKYFPTMHSKCKCSKSPPLGRTILVIAQPQGLAKMAQAWGLVWGGWALAGID